MCLVIKDFLSTVSVTFIDKTDPSNPLKRERAVLKSRHIQQTNAPHDLKITDGV